METTNLKRNQNSQASLIIAVSYIFCDNNFLIITQHCLLFIVVIICVSMAHVC